MSNEQDSEEERTLGFRDRLRVALGPPTRRRAVALLVVLVVVVGLALTGHEELARVVLLTVAANINTAVDVNTSIPINHSLGHHVD